MATFPENNEGKIARLYAAETDRVYFSLKESTISNPPGDYYFISKSHPNYQALLSLLYMAAESRYHLGVKNRPELEADQFAEVRYLVVDW